MTDDDFERRLREALTTPRAEDRVDTEDFLSHVHRGATLRRIKRGVGAGVAAVLVIAGGGTAIQLSGLLSTNNTPAAGHGTGTLRTTGNGPTSETTPSTLKSPGTTPTLPSADATLKAGPAVAIVKNGPIAATEWKPQSLTATGNDHQWVLAKTPGRDCGNSASGCASIAVTTKHGAAGSWSDLGHLPSAPAAIDAGTPTTVNQLRFVKRDALDPNSVYDGWAFGDALYSTHNSGTSWARVDLGDRKVTQLEGWGGQVWAAVSSTVRGDDRGWLYTSPTTTDNWTKVDVGVPLTGIQSLSAANGLIAFIDAGSGGVSQLYVSTDGARWSQANACPQQLTPTALSTASSSASGIGSLWVTCSDATSSAVYFADTTTGAGGTGVLGAWQLAESTALTPTDMVAARTPTEALVAGGSVKGIERITATGWSYASNTARPNVVFFGFTNDTHGYLVNSDGTIFATITGGKHFTRYAVGATP